MMNGKMNVAKSHVKVLLLLFAMVFPGLSCQKSDSSRQKGNEKSGKAELPMQELSLQIPLSREAFKNWLPDRIGEFHILKTVIGYKDAADMSAITATYGHRSDSTKQILLEILDGAGPVASVILAGSLQKLEQDFEEKEDNNFSKIHERNGQRVWEVQNPGKDFSGLEFIYGQRFLVLIKGDHIRHEDLWFFADNLDLDNLGN
ncbi:hypothetical protein [Cognataquiflexum rubidum]|uniref:hypothetical protein n=1 Tax=Cognataquiflexum rubidum TaxID=2922273 RepID=UPI001F133C27|nr:hypothetical protein [Cognataquiflexum rubidum]MCH6232959.1 hypothetical protein [Cognataquiflexum rubidum]